MTTVLITGGGGAATPGLIERLRGGGYRVLAADMDQYAVGLYLADAGFVIPAGKSPDFLQVIRHICWQEGVDVLVPLVDEVPETHLASNRTKDMNFPLVIKPRTGRGSRGLGIPNSQEELEHYLQNSPYETDALIIQEHIQGIEFTVSVVVWRDGEVQAVVPKEIIFKKGITRLAVQNTGQPVPFEINPRFSTTISLTTAAGIDECGGLIAQAVQGRNEYHFGNWQEGVVLLRRALDEFIDESTFRSLELVNLAKGVQ
jgi:carbamoyl-phosphate synthase large subunit